MVSAFMSSTPVGDVGTSGSRSYLPDSSFTSKGRNSAHRVHLALHCTVRLAVAVNRTISAHGLRTSRTELYGLPNASYYTALYGAH